MPSKLERFFDLRPGDLHRGTLLALYYFFIVTAYTSGQIARAALFLKRFEAVRLPYVDFVVAVVVGAILAVYFRIGRRIPLIHLVAGTLCFFASNVLVFFWIARAYKSVWLYPVVYVWVGVFGVLAVSQVWTLTNYVLTGREAKRLLGLIGTGGILGGIVGGFLSNIVSRSMGAETVLLLMGLSIAISTILVFTISAKNRNAGTALRSGPAIDKQRRATLRESFGLVVSSRHLLAIAALICVGSIATYIAGWQFQAIVKQAHPDEDAMAAFLGVFYGTTGLLAMPIQILLTPRLLRYFGVRIALTILPVALLGGTIALLMSGAIWAATLLRGTDKVLRYSIDSAAAQLLFLPVPSETKLQAKSFLDTVVNRVGDGLGAVAVLLLTVVVGLNPTQMGWIVLVILFLWIAIGRQAGARYVATLSDTLRQRRLDAERLQDAPPERSATQVLVTGLSSDDPAKIIYVLDLLEGQRWNDLHSSIQELLSHSAPEVRAKAVSILRRMGDATVISRVEQLVRDPHLAVRTEALLFLSQLTGIDPLTRIQDLGNFADFSIQAATLEFLAKSEDSSNLEAARLILDNMVNDDSPSRRQARLEAARLIRILPDSFAGYLCPLLEGDDNEILIEATRTAGNRQDLQYVSPLIALLGNPEVTGEVSKALAQFGPSMQGSLREHLSDPAIPLEVKREIPALLVTIAKREARDTLLENLRQADNILRLRIISSLNKLHHLYPDIELDTATVELVLASEMMSHYRAYQIIGKVADHRDRKSFDVPLQKSIHHELERIFRLLKMLYPKHDLQSAFVGLQSGNKTDHDSALEFIDNTLKPSIRRLLVPLVDAEIPLIEKVELANRVLPSTIDSKDDALLALMGAEDPWLKSCAAHLIGILGLKQFQAEVDRWAVDRDPGLREKALRARQRLAEHAS